LKVIKRGYDAINTFTVIRVLPGESGLMNNLDNCKIQENSLKDGVPEGAPSDFINAAGTV
jgi:hypothetical protein